MKNENSVLISGQKLCKLGKEACRSHSYEALEKYINSFLPDMSMYFQKVSKSHFCILQGNDALRYFISSNVNNCMGQAAAKEAYQLGYYILNFFNPVEKTNPALSDGINCIIGDLVNRFMYIPHVYNDYMLHISILDCTNKTLNGCSQFGSINVPSERLFNQKIFLFCNEASLLEKELYLQLASGMLYKYDTLGGDSDQLLSNVMKCFEKPLGEAGNREKLERLLYGLGIGLMDESHKQKLFSGSMSPICDDTKLSAIVEQIIDFVSRK